MAISIINSKSLDVTGQDGTGAAQVPSGTTAQRPASPANGYIRYNTTIADFEVYNGSWVALNYTAAPTNTVAPVISGSTAIGQTLSCTTGTWTNTPTGYYYQWLANSTAITSATANTFTLTSTQLGANITCNVTAYNIAGNSTPSTSNSLGPVVSTYDIQYMAVAGGGGGGNSYSGGGGAGGFLSNTATVTPGLVITVTLGSGGTNGGGNGSNTTITAGGSFSNITCVGGGGGGNQSNPGKAGGSSGGGAAGNTYGTPTTGQGNRGGAGGSGAGGGGGGAGGVGSTGGNGSFPDAPGGGGGSAIANPITGSTAGVLSGGIYYLAGGGGGGGGYGSGGGGGGAGNGGGGSGGYASANTGSGGGGDNGVNDPRVGGYGGSGVVVFSMPTAKYSGTYTGSSVAITTSGSNTIVTFNSSGTYTA